MARDDYPEYISQGTPPSGPHIVVQPASGPAMPATDTGAAKIGEAVTAAGAQIQDIGIRMSNAEDHVRATLGLTNYYVKAAERQQRAESDPNYFDSPEKLKADLDAIKAESLAGIRDPVRHASAEQTMTMHGIAAVHRSQGHARSKMFDAERSGNDIQDQGDTSEFIAAETPEQKEAIRTRVNARYDRAAAAGIYTQVQATNLKQKWNEKADHQEVLHAIAADPAAALANLNKKGSYPYLDPVQREHLKISAQNSVNQGAADELVLKADRGDPDARAIVDAYTKPQQAPGLVEPGNIDLTRRPTVTDPATGKTATILSETIEADGRHVLIPRVSDTGEILTPEQAVAQFRATGRHLGVFENQEQADAYAKQLSAAQGVLYTSPAGKTFNSLPPHQRFRTVQAMKHQLDANDSAARSAASAAASLNRSTDEVVNVIKEGGDVSQVRVQQALTLNQAAADRGDATAAKYVRDLQEQLVLQPYVRAAWQMSPEQLAVAVRDQEAQITAAGGDPNAAQFRALHAFKAVLTEQTRIKSEEPVLFGKGTRVYDPQPIDISRAAAGDSNAATGLQARGEQARYAFNQIGGSGSPFLKQEAVQFKEQYTNAQAGQRFGMLQTLAHTMPDGQIYAGAVEAVTGNRQFANETMRRLLIERPGLAKEIMAGAAVLSDEKLVKEKASEVQRELQTILGGQQIFINKEQQQQAVNFALMIDAARRGSPASGALYDPKDTTGLQKALEDVVGPLRTINGLRTPVTPGIEPHVFTNALRRLDVWDLAGAGGVRDRSGNVITPKEIADRGVLRPTEPGGSIYFVGVKDARSPDGFMPYFDENGRPVQFDMRKVSERHAAAAPAGETPGKAARRTREQILRSGDTEAVRLVPEGFEQQVAADLRKQFPNETDEQIAARAAAVSGQMTTPAQRQFYQPRTSDYRSFNQSAWDMAVESWPESQNIEDRRPSVPLPQPDPRQPVLEMRPYGYRPVKRLREPQ